MSLLNLDSGGKERSRKPLKVILGIGGLAAVVALASTLAANININSGPVEFGQGVSSTTACDDSITVTPYSTFVNAVDTGTHMFTSLKIGGIDSSSDKCAGKIFVIKAYGDSGQLDLFNWETNVPNPDTRVASEWQETARYNYIEIWKDVDEFVWVSEGSDDDDVFSDTNDIENTSFTLDLTSGTTSIRRNALASAQLVKRITVETKQGPEVAAEYVADYNPGSTNFNSTPIFSIDANSVSPGDQLWTDTNTASTFNLTANADFSSSANSYADFANVQATADLGSSITTMDRVTVELWVNFRDSGARFSASPFSFDTTDDREDIAGCGYNLSFNDGYLGINTCNSDTLGFLATNLNDAWHHIIWIASTGDRYTQKIYVDGQLKLLTRYDSGENPDLQENPRPNIGSGIIGVNTWDPLNALKIGAINVYAGEMPLASIDGRYINFQSRLT
jgi:hypothetical protein